MKEFVPLPAIEREPVDIASLPTNMSWEDAEQLLGFPTTDGRKILGVTTKPGLGYTDGIYVVVTGRNAKATYQLVGDSTAPVSS